MINRQALLSIVFAGMVSVLSLTPASAQDASFACKVLLCGASNWPTIPYCVPIMQQAIWMNALGVAIGLCAEAMQNQTTNDAQPGRLPSPPPGAAANIPATPLPCAPGSIPMSATSSGSYTVDLGGSLCGSPQTSQAQADLAACAHTASAVCPKLFTDKEIRLN